MRAIIQDRYGSPDALKLREIEKPVAGATDVLVRVHAAGVSPGVWHLMKGEPYIMRLTGLGLRGPKARPGGDFAGTVEAVGTNVSQFQPGDEVFGAADGAFAEYLCARENQIAAKPKNLTFEQAAAVPDSGRTALRGLRDVGAIKSGQRVAIVGAAGGIGTFAVQIAKALGAEVTGVCSATKTDLVLSLGADHAIDYTKEDFADGGQRYDLILDTAGRRSLSHLRRALAPEGTLVLIGGEGGGRLLGGINRQLGAMMRSAFVRQRLVAPVYLKHPREDLGSLKELIEAGKVEPVIDRTFPLSETAEAIRHWERGHARGKIVVTV